MISAFNKRVISEPAVKLDHFLSSYHIIKGPEGIWSLFSLIWSQFIRLLVWGKTSRVMTLLDLPPSGAY